MSVTEARAAVTCPTCNTQRVVTDRHARRARTIGGIPCQTCRGRTPLRAQATEQGLRFWLKAYGTNVPQGHTAASFIAAGGAPPELVDLARTLYPPPR
jgi:hypothetical protein